MRRFALVWMLVACASPKRVAAPPAVASAAPAPAPAPSAPRVAAVQPPCVVALANRLRGCVRDEWSAAPIVGATVAVTAADGTVQTTITDASGAWGIDAAGTDFAIGVYHNDLDTQATFHIPDGAPPYLVPTIAFDTTAIPLVHIENRRDM